MQDSNLKFKEMVKITTKPFFLCVMHVTVSHERLLLLCPHKGAALLFILLMIYCCFSMKYIEAFKKTAMNFVWRVSPIRYVEINVNPYSYALLFTCSKWFRKRIHAIVAA